MLARVLPKSKLNWNVKDHDFNPTMRCSEIVKYDQFCVVIILPETVSQLWYHQTVGEHGLLDTYTKPTASQVLEKANKNLYVKRY